MFRSFTVIRYESLHVTKKKYYFVVILENKHLFSSESILTAKYINPAPFTAYFPAESPGRTGIWIGWQIVRSFMEKNPQVTLPELMNNPDAQGILERSGYAP